MEKLFANEQVSAVAIGNSLSYREIAHKSLISESIVEVARATSFGDLTKGARDW